MLIFGINRFLLGDKYVYYNSFYIFLVVILYGIEFILGSFYVYLILIILVFVDF